MIRGKINEEKKKKKRKETGKGSCLVSYSSPLIKPSPNPTEKV